MSAKSRQCCIKASRSIAANIPSFFPHYCIFVLIYCCPCVTTLTWHRCSRNQNNRVRQKIPASVLDKCQNIFLYYYYLCVYVCVCVRKIHSSRGRREKKEKKVTLENDSLISTSFEVFLPFPIYLQDDILGCLAPAFPAPSFYYSEASGNFPCW